MPNVFIVDPQPVARLGIRAIIEADPDYTVAGEASDAAEVARLTPHNIDVLVVDARNRGELETLRQTCPRTPFVLFQESPQNGAAAVAVSKRAESRELLRGLAAALRGETFVATRKGSAKEPHEQLSAREREVLTMVLEGRRPKEIAFELEISVKTISTHRFRIMRKLGVQSDVGLVRYAIRHALTFCD